MEFIRYTSIIFLIVLKFSRTGEATNYDLLSPLVFEPQFYINTNNQLHHRGIDTVEKAKRDWLHHGLHEGLQGCGSFHTKQYLARYHDLNVAFGTNYTGAAIHYLTHQHELRYGYQEGGFHGRWTISSDREIFISVSARMGGAIDSLVWNNKEMINCYDHGREMQMALNSNTHGECFNPTEAGGRDDRTSGTTKSSLKYVKAAGNSLESEVYPAFWLRPGDFETAITSSTSCSKGGAAMNREATYRYPFWKKVTIGVHGINNCIEFISNFTISNDFPTDIDWIQLESPAVYMPFDFTEKYNYNIKSLVEEYYHSNHLPVVLSTQDGQYAMGGFAPDGQDVDMAVSNGATSFTHSGSYPSKTNKWNLVFRKSPFTDGDVHHLTYKSYICVGTLNMVSNCLHKIISAVPRI